MPGQTQQSSFNFAAAAKKHARDETKMRQDFTNLPGGIVGGEAEVSAGKVGTYENGDMKGQRFIYLGASVLAPTVAIHTVKTWDPKANGGRGGVVIVSSKEVKIDGLQTRLMLPLGPSKKKSAEENVAAALNELRCVGGDECVIPLENCKTEAEAYQTLEGIVNALVNADPPIRIKFGTQDMEPTPEYPNSRSFENWYGAITYDAVPGNPGAHVQENGVNLAAPSETAEPFSEFGDLDSLAEAANGGDEAAQGKLEEAAAAAGVAEEVNNAPNWTKAVEIIKAAGQGSGDGDQAAPEAEQEWKPSAGEIYKIEEETLKDPKNPKKGKVKKKRDVEVQTVDEAGRTVTASYDDTKKAVMDGKKSRKIAWDDLIVE